MESVKRGEIWLANLNPSKGTQPGKIRPVVIVQTDLLNEIHNSTIVCPLTSKVLPEVEYLRVHLKPTKSSGLEKDSDILTDQLIALDNKRFIQKTGSISSSDLKKLERSLSVILGLE